MFDFAKHIVHYMSISMSKMLQPRVSALTIIDNSATRHNQIL